MLPFRSIGLRSWATPLTIGSFLLMAVTGVLMFFDIVPGYVSFAHEWASWLFLLGVVAHVAVNLRPFQRHLKTRGGAVSVTAFALVLLASPISFGRITAPQLKWPVFEKLVEAPLTAVAAVAGLSTEVLLAIYARHGIDAQPWQSIKDLSEAHGEDAFHLVGIAFLRQDLGGEAPALPAAD
ncbi:DUF4405 domain-containing protein [Paracoccus pantotrophus]|uniref:DUF4405 domain-containing protein n=1 Tax=Paracoccus pantotrophus TaxID=82367 RepID=UPI0008EEA5CC|nr:DUF4405 domain-containing protein [Paracoccus pantotrophus]MDF3856533.1 DUF4405 domain-containing protein [Paracoccus pantotrophus]SFP21872.1 protein of unknown function [Paracoccus pantotrophus]